MPHNMKVAVWKGKFLLTQEKTKTVFTQLCKCSLCHCDLLHWSQVLEEKHLRSWWRNEGENRECWVVFLCSDLTALSLKEKSVHIIFFWFSAINHFSWKVTSFWNCAYLIADHISLLLWTRRQYFDHIHPSNIIQFHPSYKGRLYSNIQRQGDIRSNSLHSIRTYF